LYNNPHNAKVFHYLAAYLLLDRDLERLYSFLSQYRPEGELGTHIYEATLLYLFLHNKDEFNKVMSNNNDLTHRFDEFGRFYSAGTQNPQKAKELFGHSYWFYYYYCN
jgi:hypothetical protein